MTAKRLSIPATICWVLVALASWAARGALTTVTAQAASPRVAIAPSLRWLLLLLCAGVGMSAVRRFRSPETWLLSLSAVVLLPWLPWRIVPALLVWTGPLRIWVFVAMAATVGASLAWRLRIARGAALRSVANPQWAPWVAAAIAAGLYVAGAWLVFPHLPAGDEPHYLVITQSLLRDHDLKIENNHRRGDYREYFGAELRPDYLRRGTDGEIYSIHPVGLPVLIAPAFALGGYPAVLVLLALVSGTATALTWKAVWRLTNDAAAAWFAWASVSLSAPFFFQSFTVYPDAPGAVLVMLGLLAFCALEEWRTMRLAWLGVALALLPWLHTRFVLLEAALVLLLLARLARSGDAVRRSAALAAAPIASTACWLAFFYVIYGTANPAAPYNGYTQSELGNLARGVPGLLFDAQFGVLANAPVFLFAPAGFWTLARRRPALGLGLLLVIAPYAGAVAMYAMWWAGYSSPARFLVPVVLALAIPIGVWFSALRSRSATLLACGSLLVSLLITATIALVDRGALLFNVRDGSSRLLVWLSPVVDVTTGFPSLFRTSPSTAIFDAAIWLALLLLVAVLGRLLDRRRISTPALTAALGASLVAAGSIALTLVWRTNAAQPLTPATGGAAFLQAFDPDVRQFAVRFSPVRRLDPAAVPAMITLARADPAEKKPDEPLIWAPYLSAGTYEIEARLTRPTTGRISVTMDREFGAAWTWSLDGARGFWRQGVSLPMPARVLLVDADAEARGALQDAAFRATRILGTRERLSSEEPWHVVRYGPAVVFLMNGHAYTEPGGTWVAGGESADFVIVPDPGARLSLFVRNAPVANR